MRRAAQVSTGDQRKVEAWAGDHYVWPALVDPIRLPPVVRRDDDVDVRAKGLQLGCQKAAVQPRRPDLEHDGPRVGKEAGEGDLEPRVAGEEDPLPPYTVPQDPKVLPSGSGPHDLAGSRSGFLCHVLDEAGRAVDSNGHEGLDHRCPALLGGRYRCGQVRVHHGHHRALPNGWKLPCSGPRYGPCYLRPGPGELRGEALRGPWCRGATEQHHGTAIIRIRRFEASSQQATEEPAALRRSAGFHEVRGSPLRAEVHQGGEDTVLEVGGEDARDLVGGIGIHYLGRKVELAGYEPGLEGGIDPERFRRSSRHEQHEPRAAEPGGGLHDAGGQKSLLRWVVGVEDREDHPRIALGGGEVGGGRGRQTLDEVRFGLRTDDDKEYIGKRLCQAIYGMQRRENVWYPRLIEDRHSTFLSSGGRYLARSTSSPQEVLV